MWISGARWTVVPWRASGLTEVCGIFLAVGPSRATGAGILHGAVTIKTGFVSFSNPCLLSVRNPSKHLY